MYEGVGFFLPFSIFYSSSTTHLSKVSAVHLCSSSDLATVNHFYLERRSVRHWKSTNLILDEELMYEGIGFFLPF